MPDLPLFMLSCHHDLLVVPYRSEMVPNPVEILYKEFPHHLRCLYKSCESRISIKSGQWHLISRLAVMPFSITLLHYTDNICSTELFLVYRHLHELHS